MATPRFSPVTGRLFFALFLWTSFSALSMGQTFLSREWHDAYDASWRKAIERWPEAGEQGSFADRMREIHEWAKDHDRTLYESPDKPVKIAFRVHVERDAAPSISSALSESEETLPQEPNNDTPEASSPEVERQTEIESLLLFLLAPLVMTLVGFGLSLQGGIARGSLWLFLLLGAILGVFSGAIGGSVFSVALGSRARNAGYSWPLAVLSGIPLISLPCVLGLLFQRNGRLWINEKAAAPERITPSSQVTPKPMKLDNFNMSVAEAKEIENGYAILGHGTQYTLVLGNESDRRCDVEVTIDGSIVGVWRIEPNDEIRIERPSGDTGRFTFLAEGTEAARAAGLQRNDELGLISAEFRPERVRSESDRNALSAAPLSDAGEVDAGGTGLSGESTQRFVKVPALEVDYGEVRTIHLRLVARKLSVRPLSSRATPVPPPILD